MIWYNYYTAKQRRCSSMLERLSCDQQMGCSIPPAGSTIRRKLDVAPNHRGQTCGGFCYVHNQPSTLQPHCALPHGSKPNQVDGRCKIFDPDTVCPAATQRWQQSLQRQSPPAHIGRSSRGVALTSRRPLRIALAFRMGLHRKFTNRLPESVIAILRDVRAGVCRRRLQSSEGEG